MASSSLDIILSVQNVGFEPHTVTVYPGASIKFSLQPFLQKYGLRHDELTVYDTTRKMGVDWDETVDGLLASTILISDKMPLSPLAKTTPNPFPHATTMPSPSATSTGRRASDAVPTVPFRGGKSDSPAMVPYEGRKNRSHSLPGVLLSEMPDRPLPPPPLAEDVMTHGSKAGLMDVSKLHCYHGTLTTNEVERLLKGRPPFSFLVRDSVTRPGNFTVSATYHDNNIFHFRVNNEGDKYFVTEFRKFSNIVALLRYFQNHPIPGQAVQDLRLLHPIPRLQTGKSEADRGYTHFIKKEELGPVRYLSTTSHASQEYLENLKQNLPARASRPPAPLPQGAAAIVGSKGVYSSPIEEEKSRLPELIEALAVHEYGGESARRCVCGLLVHEATLIDGWTMHLSNDPATSGQVYFARGDEVVWDLPEKTMTQLDKVCPQKANEVRKRLLSD